MIGFEDAVTQAKVLLDASGTSTCRQLRYEMRRRGREWDAAARLLGALEDDEGVIEVVGSVCPGMFVFDEGSENDEWRPVIRSFESRGQWSIHWQDAVGRDRYANFYGPSSPCVVKA